MIGPEWLAAVDEQGRRRLERPDDFVCHEIERALARGIRVIPVLVGEASMPSSDELPEALRALSRRNAIALRDDAWRTDVDRLIGTLGGILEPPTPEASKPSSSGTTRRRAGPWRLPGGIALGAVAGLSILLGSENIQGLAQPHAPIDVPSKKPERPPLSDVSSGPVSRSREVQADSQSSNPVIRDCDVCPELVPIPTGTFSMGSDNSELERDSGEGPRHEVRIAAGFAIGRYEVTFDEWDACLSAGGCTERPDDKGWGRGRLPVINVSWEDAQQYVAWLSRNTGKLYRLPSEAEWEYAARAGTATPFHTGPQIAPDQANYDGTYFSVYSLKGAFRGKTEPVGTFPPNAFGLYDVHGNVWEWVQDRHHNSYGAAPPDGSAWEQGESARRVLRGASWQDYAGALRSAYRNGYDADRRTDSTGFRVARTLP
jgi:formylglycine-generating enzyme required for sulfatase activity